MEKSIDHAQRGHALLSASGASRWLNCPPSALKESKIADTSSRYAKEGTLAHEFCDINVKEHFKHMSKSVCTKNRNKFRKDKLYSKEMEDYAKDYLDYIIEKVKSDDACVLAETQVDFSQYVPEGFGTCDCIIIQDDTLTIIDFKYGQGVSVAAEDNPQMRLYALGAIEMFGDIYDFDKVEMCIYQPRIGNVDESTELVELLVKWGEETVQPTAKLAYEGKGEMKAGNHCTFCKLRATCRCLNDYCMETVKEDFEDVTGTLSTYTLEPSDIAMILERIKLVKNWLTDVEEYAISGILNGSLEVPGYKVVEGRSIRKYTDADQVASVLIENGYDESAIYERNLLSLSKMEKSIGKKIFSELLGDFVEKPKGKPTIVPESDKRQKYASDDDFDVVEN